jgi:hypothetical protein
MEEDMPVEWIEEGPEQGRTQGIDMCTTPTLNKGCCDDDDDGGDGGVPARAI